MLGNEGVTSVLKRMTTVLLTALVALIGVRAAYAGSCWDPVQEGHETGFDFAVQDSVSGPDSHGVYTYRYRVHRIDQGSVTYRDPSHLAIEFGCDAEAASEILLGGPSAIVMTGAGDKVCETEVAYDPAGFEEPGLGGGCRANGIKLTFCDGALVPDGDGVSYPDDPDDPVLVITFRSLSPPTYGEWFMKGGRLFSPIFGTFGGARRDVEYLTDGGLLRVPGCRPPTPTFPVSWSRLKQLYR